MALSVTKQRRVQGLTRLRRFLLACDKLRIPIGTTVDPEYGVVFTDNTGPHSHLDSPPAEYLDRYAVVTNTGAIDALLDAAYSVHTFRSRAAMMIALSHMQPEEIQAVIDLDKSFVYTVKFRTLITLVRPAKGDAA